MLTRLESFAPTAVIAKRICDAISEPFELGSQTVQISTSAGIALRPAHGTETGDLLRRARRGDVPRQVARQGALDHGPRLTRIGG